MGSALWAGISGLNASSKELDVIANNIANVNTIGFKADTTFFSDVLSSSISGGSAGTLQVGRGVAVSNVQTQFGSGSFETTGNATDAAIDGDGFFMVNDSEGGTYYTRAGSFHMNSDGVLVDNNGYRLQGQMIINGQNQALSDIRLQGVQSQPSVSTTFSLGANLNSATSAGGQYNTTQTVYDSLGASHTLNLTFTKSEESTQGMWGVQAYLDSTEATGITANGFTFDSTGFMTGMYTGTMTGVASSASATTTAAITNTGTGNPTIAFATGGAADVTVASSIVLTASGATPSWSITNRGLYPNAVILGSNAATGAVNIDLDNDTVADVTLTPGSTGTVAGDTASIAFTPAHNLVSSHLDRPGMVYQTGAMQMTVNAAGVWQVSTPAGYSNATVTSVLDSTTGNTTLHVSLDGTGTSDISFVTSGTWGVGDTISYNLTNATSAVTDVYVDMSGIPLNGGATIGSGNRLVWNMVGNDALDITQYSSASVIRSVSADGYASGNLKSLSIDKTGIISGFFTNGQTSELAQIMLASFSNPWALNKLGSNLFGETVASGSSIRNIPGASGMGSLTPNTVEMSNTDIATEFIRMITAQKAYQANAKVVTTQDTVMSTLMQIMQ